MPSISTEMIPWIVVSLLFFLAYVGLIVPALPDYPLALAGFAVFHFTIDKQVMGWFFWITVIIIGMMLLLVDYVASGVAVKKKGGSKWAILAAFVGILIFPFFLGPLGIVVGPFVMVVMVEYAQKKPMNEALEVGYSTLIGFVGGVFVKFLVISAVITWFVLLNVI